MTDVYAIDYRPKTIMMTDINIKEVKTTKEYFDERQGRTAAFCQGCVVAIYSPTKKNESIKFVNSVNHTE